MARNSKQIWWNHENSPHVPPRYTLLCCLIITICRRVIEAEMVKISGAKDSKKDGWFFLQSKGWGRVDDNGGADQGKYGKLLRKSKNNVSLPFHIVSITFSFLSCFSFLLFSEEERWRKSWSFPWKRERGRERDACITGKVIRMEYMYIQRKL